MYDHMTQRPRGFGFITYDSEDDVDKVLQRTFHDLNGKMVEVKLVVPKEMSPNPNRNQMNVNNLGNSRISTLLNEYTQGFNPHLSPIISYGVKPEGRYSPTPVNRAGFYPFGYGYGIELNFEANPNQSYISGSNGGFRRPCTPAYSASLGKYGSPGEFVGGNGAKRSLASPARRNHLWGNSSLGYGSNSPIFSGFNGNSGTPSMGSIGENWGSTARSRSCRGYNDVDFNVGYGRSNCAGGVGIESSNGVHLGDYNNGLGLGSLYSDSTWRSPPSEFEEGGSMCVWIWDGTTGGNFERPRGLHRRLRCDQPTTKRRNCSVGSKRPTEFREDIKMSVM